MILRYQYSQDTPLRMCVIGADQGNTYTNAKEIDARNTCTITDTRHVRAKTVMIVRFIMNTALRGKKSETK